jgi:hypothetical protein
MARFELARKGPWDHMSGEGVSVLGAGLDEAAERGRWMWRAFAWRRRGEDMGEAGRLAVNWVVGAKERTGDELGDAE